jgi:glycosyltransferase involved in cell wall biosynthesis
VTAVGAAPDLIRNGANGILFPPKNPQAMVAAIEATLGARSRWPQIAAGARDSVARFDLATVADQYLALCGSLTYPLDDL